MSASDFRTQRRTRGAPGLLVAGGLVWLAGCPGRQVVEMPGTTIPGSKFKVIATVAGGTRSMDLRMSVTARKQLNDSGWKGVARYGRWDSRTDAVTAICGMGAWMGCSSWNTTGSSSTTAPRKSLGTRSTDPPRRGWTR